MDRNRARACLRVPLSAPQPPARLPPEAPRFGSAPKVLRPRPLNQAAHCFRARVSSWLGHRARLRPSIQWPPLNLSILNPPMRMDCPARSLPEAEQTPSPLLSERENASLPPPITILWRGALSEVSESPRVRAARSILFLPPGFLLTAFPSIHLHLEAEPYPAPASSGRQSWWPGSSPALRKKRSLSQPRPASQPGQPLRSAAPSSRCQGPTSCLGKGADAVPKARKAR